MYLNPVGFSDYDQLFADMAADYKDNDSEVHISSLTQSVGNFSHLEYRTYEAFATRDILLATRKASQLGFDALVIGCFYDTALEDAREISGDMIVVAPCIASLEIAASLSNRFGIIVGRDKWINQMHNTVKHYGYSEQLTGFYSVGLGVNDFQADHSRTEKLLIEAGRKAVEEDKAEALILGCTLEIGFHKKLEDVLGVPVIDPSIASLKRAEYAATLKNKCGFKPSRKYSCEAPSESELTAFNLFNQEQVFGNTITVAAN